MRMRSAGGQGGEASVHIAPPVSRPSPRRFLARRSGAPRRSRARWAVGALGWGSVLLLVAACSGIPSSGPVEEGRSLVEQDAGEVEFLPLGPAPDASQENILRGFVAAFSGSAGDFEVARQFLSSGYSDQWDPRVGVTVRGNVERFVPVDGDTLSYSLNAAAVVDPSGAYTENVVPVPISLSFDFVQQEGQWRISDAPDGIVLADAQFQSIYDDYALWFLDPSAERLVPDIRWFEGGTAPLQIVSALLAGPPDWLRGAVRTAFPTGTSLAAPAVDVESGVAAIDLSPEALTADAGERRLMQEQLLASLADVASIRRVSLSVGDAPIEIPVSPDPPLSGVSRVDGRPVVLLEGQFGYLDGDAVTTIDGLSAGVTAAAPTAGIFDEEAGRVVVLGPAGVSDIRSGVDGVRLLDGRGGLVAPALDADGFVWTAQSADPTTLRVIDQEGGALDLPTDVPTGITVAATRISRDGARLATVYATPTGARVVVRAIVRDASGSLAPTALGEPVLDATVSGNPLDVTWVDDFSVAVLAAGAEETVTLLAVGGASSSLGSPDSAVALVGGNGVAGLRALSAAKSVVARTGNSWTDTGVTVDFVAGER